MHWNHISATLIKYRGLEQYNVMLLGVSEYLIILLCGDPADLQFRLHGGIAFNSPNDDNGLSVLTWQRLPLGRALNRMEILTSAGDGL